MKKVLAFFAIALIAGVGCNNWPNNNTAEGVITVKCRWEYGDKFNVYYCKECSNSRGCEWKQRDVRKKRSYKHRH